jgi:hypothetical protein
LGLGQKKQIGNLRRLGLTVQSKLNPAQLSEFDVTEMFSSQKKKKRVFLFFCLCISQKVEREKKRTSLCLNSAK